ncbi:Mitochondrial large ribosomal subunit L49 [Penicillium paradoxum]|uniref:Mitochondrial large ribosomal subunit L49 n=1 Tax=Penicillium paradoxum TaxID=176176 RepID=UPI002549A719|nr:Mitochondrial large ribosomal subunit L49 [Penicillium paradoxum]KAJ5793615.1 Mitochondrial large ribosomal subunit L49 [Penicillium paradoxum]
MASFLYSGPASAMRKQATTISLRVNSAQSVASVQTCSSFSTLCSQTRLQASHRPQCALSSLPTRQSRTFLTHLGRQAQALKEQPAAPSATPTPGKSPKKPTPTLQLTNLPYFVRRTASNQLPVYLVTKAGGTKQLTKIQKTEGDLDALRNDLASALGVVDGNKPNPDVTLNRLTGHIIVKGWRKPEILNFLQERKF